MKRKGLLGIAAVVIALACVEDLSGFLNLNVTAAPPDTTHATTVELAGSVFRTPVRSDLLYIVTVTGGESTVSDTASLHGQFSVVIPLTTNAENRLVATASDGLGSPTPSPWEKTVVQIDTTAQPQ